MESFESVEDDLHILCSNPDNSSSSSSCASSSNASSASGWSPKKKKPHHGEEEKRCSFCDYPFERLEYSFGTCTPECALGFCSDNAHNFNATHANIRSRFPNPNYYPKAIPSTHRERNGLSRAQYFNERIALCYGNDSSVEKSVRENAFQYATSKDLPRG